MLNKISIIKTNILPEKDNVNREEISGLVTMDEKFTYIRYIYNMKQKIQTQQSDVNLNPKIIEVSKKLIFTKLIYEKSKKK